MKSGFRFLNANRYVENVTYSGVGGIFCPDYFLFSGFCGHKRCEIFSSPGSVYTCFDGGKRGSIGFLDRFDFAFGTGVLFFCLSFGYFSGWNYLGFQTME